MIRLGLGALLCVLAFPSAAAEVVRFPSADSDLTGGVPTEIEARLFRPEGPGPFPAVIGLHGCNGLYWRDGSIGPREREWAEILTRAGQAVLYPDSFRPRGVRELCSDKADPRIARPGVERSRDVWGALSWLARQPSIRADALVVMGWSHGGSTVLWSIFAGNRGRPSATPEPKLAIAFYPGCRSALNRPDWSAGTPLLVLIGDADDWTPVQPCRELEARERARGRPFEMVVYPGAFHGFDRANRPPLVLGNVGSTRSGTATIGTDPAARADAIARVLAALGSVLER